MYQVPISGIFRLYRYPDYQNACMDTSQECHYHEAGERCNLMSTGMTYPLQRENTLGQNVNLWSDGEVVTDGQSGIEEAADRWHHHAGSVSLTITLDINYISGCWKYRALTRSGQTSWTTKKNGTVLLNSLPFNIRAYWKLLDFIRMGRRKQINAPVHLPTWIWAWDGPPTLRSKQNTQRRKLNYSRWRNRRRLICRMHTTKPSCWICQSPRRTEASSSNASGERAVPERFLLLISAGRTSSSFQTEAYATRYDCIQSLLERGLNPTAENEACWLYILSSTVLVIFCSRSLVLICFAQKYGIQAVGYYSECRERMANWIQQMESGSQCSATASTFSNIPSENEHFRTPSSSGLHYGRNNGTDTLTYPSIWNCKTGYRPGLTSCKAVWRSLCLLRAIPHACVFTRSEINCTPCRP